MSPKSVSKALFGLVLAVFCLWWVLKDTDPELLWSTLKNVSWPLLALCVFLNLGHNVFRVWRWKALLEPVKKGLHFRPMFAAIILGYMTSWLIPGRIGELVRPLLLSGRERVPLGPCIGSVVGDRLFDASTIVVMFTISVWLTPLSDSMAEYAPLLKTGSVTLAGGVVVMLAVMLILAAYDRQIEAWADRRGGWLAWFGRTAVALSHGVSALRQPRLAAQIVVHSALAWGTIVIATWCGIRAVGAEVSMVEVMFITPLLVFGIALPTPGGAGSYHGAMKVGLALFAVPEVIAVSAGLVVHAAITIPTIVLGTILLWTEGVSWNDLLSGARQFKQLGGRSVDRPLERQAEGAS